MSDYRTSGEGGPDPNAPVMEDWDPNAPDAVRVHYDLAAWTIDQRAELAAVFADALVPHAWGEGDAELLVPESYESLADDLIAELEDHLDVQPLRDDAAAGDAGPTPDPVELPAGIEAVEYDLAEWTDGERDLIARQLLVDEVAHRWEDRLLLVGAADEARMDAILDGVESGVFDGEFDDDDLGEQLPFESLTTFFLAAERLARNPADAAGLERLVEAEALAHVRRPPYGVEPGLWRQTRAVAERVVAALVDGDEPDTDAARTAAQELHDLLRPII